MKGCSSALKTHNSPSLPKYQVLGNQDVFFLNTYNMEANGEPLLNAHIWSEQGWKKRSVLAGPNRLGRAKLSKEADSFDVTPYA